MTHRPNHRCPKCAERGDVVTTWTKALNRAGSKVWECTLCWHQEPRQTRNSRRQREIDETLRELGLTT